MSRLLDRITAAIRNGNAASIMLLYGDDFEVQEVCKTILDLIVPEAQRGFNLERFDGRSTSWERIQAALDTPPFLPGKKVVWVENAPYFLSRENSGELRDRVLRLWLEGKKGDACKLFMDLLSVASWTGEQWEQAQSGLHLGALRELLGGEGRDLVEQLLAHCRISGVDWVEARGAEAQRLLKLLEQGLPPWDFLLLTANEVDRRARLYKRVDDLGAALHLGSERDRSGRLSRENLLEFINRRAGQAGKTIGYQARETIVLRAGGDLRGIHHELEKLFLYVGDQPEIRLQDVNAVFTDQAEGWVFDLTRSLADSDAVAALSHLARLMSRGEHGLKLLATIASEVRRLLAARQLIDGELSGRWKRGMTYQQFQQTVIRDQGPLLTRSPYADYVCFQRAEKFSLARLRCLLAQICDADLRLKSTGNPPRLVMERLVLNMCLGTQDEIGLIDNRTRG